MFRFSQEVAFDIDCHEFGSGKMVRSDPDSKQFTESKYDIIVLYMFTYGTRLRVALEITEMDIVHHLLGREELSDTDRNELW